MSLSASECVARVGPPPERRQAADRLVGEASRGRGPQSAVSELLEAFRTGDGVDLIRESVRMVMLELI